MIQCQGKFFILLYLFANSLTVNLSQFHVLTSVLHKPLTVREQVVEFSSGEGYLLILNQCQHLKNDQVPSWSARYIFLWQIYAKYFIKCEVQEGKVHPWVCWNFFFVLKNIFFLDPMCWLQVALINILADGQNLHVY